MFLNSQVLRLQSLSDKTHIGGEIFNESVFGAAHRLLLVRLVYGTFFFVFQINPPYRTVRRQKYNESFQQGRNLFICSSGSFHL